MNWTILIAANRPDVLKGAPDSWKSAGVRILLARSGLDAMRRARAEGPDLIVLDAELPDIDGATVADILKRLPSTAAIPVILAAYEGERSLSNTDFWMAAARALSNHQAEEFRQEGHKDEELAAPSV